jgi:monofunctional biosynthetic peptidoglycan transglycosylase
MGKSIRGGSTISQQTAKNIFCTPSRTYVRKVFEAYFTILIEFIWGKERIIEVYLNSIEMGDGVFGAEAAAKHYFSTSAAALDRYDAYYIANNLSNPRLYLK